MISDDDWYTPTIHCSNGSKLPVDEASMPQLSVLKKYMNKQMKITLPVLPSIIKNISALHTVYYKILKFESGAL